MTRAVCPPHRHSPPPARPGRGAARVALLLVLGLGAATAAQAQRTYRCQGPNGYYYADRPCVVDSGSTKLGGYGPLPEDMPPPRSRGPLVIERAPDHLSYMSPECASLSDGIRTAPSRGISYDTLNSLRRDYARRCSGDEAQARRRMMEERSAGYRPGGSSPSPILGNTADPQTQRLMDQCAEMRRSIASRNERIATLTPGEVADLHRFEANYAQRCQSKTP